MAFDVGSVVAHINADVSDFKSGIDQAKSKTSELRNHIDDFGSSLNGFMQKAAIVGTAVAGAFTLIAKSAIDSASQFEQNRIAFETMLGSAEKAKVLMKQLSDFSLKTPFELPQLNTASKELLAYGVTAENLIPTLKNLGDIASGVGMDKLPNLVLAFGQVKAATKLTGMELRQFTEAGVPLLQALVDQANKSGGALVSVGGAAKKTKVDVAELNDKLAIASQRLKEAEGNAKTKQSTLMSLRNTVQNYQQQIAKATTGTAGFGAAMVKSKVTVADMQEMISNGDVKFEQVQQALAGMTGEGGKFFNMMERQSQTFGGTLSNIQDAIGRFFRTVMGIEDTGDIKSGSIFEKLKIAAEAVMNFLLTNGPVIADFINNGIGQLAPLIGSFVAALQPLGQWIMANQEMVVTFLKGFAIAIGALLILGTIGAMIAMVMNPITWIVVAVTALYAAWQTNFWGIRDITNQVVTEVINFFNNYLRPAVEELMKRWNEIWPFMSRMLKDQWDIIVGVIQIAWNLAYGIIKVGLALFAGNWQGAWDAAKQALSGAWDGITRIFYAALDMIRGWGGKLIDELTRPFRDAWNQINDFVNKIKDALDFTKRHSPSVVDIVNRGVGLVNKALQGIDYGINVTPHAAALAVTNGGTSNMVNQITIDMNGAMIADQFGAQAMGELVGDAIIKKLQMNIRI